MKTQLIGRHPSLIRRAPAILTLRLTTYFLDTYTVATPIGAFCISLTNETLGNKGSISVDSGAQRIFASSLYTCIVTLIDLYVSGRRPIKGVPSLTSAKTAMDIVEEVHVDGKYSLDVKNVKFVGTPKQKWGRSGHSRVRSCSSRARRAFFSNAPKFLLNLPSPELILATKHGSLSL